MSEQKMRYTDAELQIIKHSFAENEDLLKIIRKFMWQEELTSAQKDILKAEVVTKEGTLTVVEKCFLPKLESDAPIHQVVDLWLTVSFKDIDPVLADIEIKKRGLLISYLEQQIDSLKNIDKVPSYKIVFTELLEDTKDPLQNVINVSVRNQIIQHTEQQIYQIFVLAGKKQETIESTKERLQKASAK